MGKRVGESDAYRKNMANTINNLTLRKSQISVYIQKIGNRQRQQVKSNRTQEKAVQVISN